jgi:phosphatidylglycerol:prolipoprotein diacylglycerol transferase
MLALSFLLGIWFATWRAKKAGLDENVPADVGFWIIISAIVGARAYYVMTHFHEFKDDLFSIINPFHNGEVGIGGLVMYGGFIGAILASLLYFKLKKLPVLPYADVLAPPVAIGIMLTRIGCFMNGCCWGQATQGPLGVSFPLSSPAGAYQCDVHAAALLPTQLFESAGGLFIAIMLLLVERKKPFTGILFYLLCISYAVLRFIMEALRVYTPGEMLFGMTHNQVICIGLFIICGGLIVRGLLLKSPTVNG